MAAGHGGDPTFELAMRHAPVGMAIIAPDGAFIEVNPALCLMLGRTEAELRAATWQELTHAEDLAADVALVQQVLDGTSDGYRLEKRYLRPDGTVVHGDLSVSSVREDDGSVRYFISQILDVTERQTLQERYRLLAENVSDVVVLGGDDGVMRWVSPSVATVTGWVPDELVGTRFIDLVHPEDREGIAAMQQRIHEGRLEAGETRLQMRDGSYRWMSIRVKPVLDASGTVVGRVGSWWDVHDARLAQDMLRHVTGLYRAALDAALDPHVLLEAVRDESGAVVDLVYTDANELACQYVRLARDYLVGGRLLELFPGQRGSGLFDDYVATVTTGRPLILDEVPVLSEIAGSRRLFDFRGVKVGDGLSLTWRDVTERVQARRAVEESEQHYRLLAENASDVVFQGSPQAVLQWVSPSIADILGGTPEDHVGRPVAELIDPRDLEAMRTASQDVNAGERVSYRARVHGPQGERWVEVTAKPVRDSDGNVVARVGSLRDVHERVVAELALEESERQARDLAERYEVARNEALEANLAKTAFLSRMSHELRTPLNSVLGFAQLLEMGALHGDEEREAHQTIRRAGQHLLRMIEEILDISRIEAGRLSLSMESVNLGDAVREALDIVGPQADAAGVGVMLDADRFVDGNVWADRQRVIQVLLNLVTNAVKYNRRGGTVRVWASADGAASHAVRIEDTGFGLSETQRVRLFEPFDRLGAETSSVEGTGIGLALSSALARVMSGRIDVESEVGVGSTFSLVLPLSQVEPGAEPVLLHAPGADPARPVDVLYVEDNPANVALMRRIAGLREQVSLRVETEGGAGAQAALDQVPDLVLLDLHLPDVQGEEVLRRLRADERTADVPVVVVTADASLDARSMLHALGADAIITKPLDVGVVLQWLDEPRRHRDRA